MKKHVFILVVVSTLLFITACSSNSNESTDEKSVEEADMQTESLQHLAEFSEEDQSLEEAQSFEEATESEDVENVAHDMTERMIIHQAQLHIEVKNLDKMQATIESNVKKHDGYIVESNVHRENEEVRSGYMVVRIPEKHFQSFLSDTEETAAEVLERNVSGQDVTEQYVDLESRLTSKQAVEKRLLAFMEDAKKTEDLLKISDDLATVQEEIEVIVGKMKYLENQTAYSTVSISIEEHRVIIPELENKDLDTWERAKKQLATSTNFLLATASAIVVFFIGNLPIIVILSVISFLVYLVIKRKQDQQKS